MLEHAFFPEWGLHWVRAQPGCTLLHIVEHGMKLSARGGPGSDLDLPGLFDLRATELDKDSTQGIKRAIRLRKGHKAGSKAKTGQNPCAYVVGSRGSFGIMRMYGIYAEIEGLRREEFTLVTDDMDEAAGWIIGHLKVDEAAAAQIRETLAQPAADVAQAAAR